jgi:hypothetical protein
VENPAPTGIRSPDCPARSQSLYGLMYPAHPHDLCKTSKINFEIQYALKILIHLISMQLKKGKVNATTVNKGPQQEWRYSYTLPLTSALDGVGSQCYTPADLPPGKKPGTKCTEGCVGPRGGLDNCGKSRSPTSPRYYYAITKLIYMYVHTCKVFFSTPVCFFHPERYCCHMSFCIHYHLCTGKYMQTHLKLSSQITAKKYAQT